jgi:hypothetical protein
MADLARLRAILRDTDPAEAVGNALPLFPPMEKLLGRRLKRGAVVAIEGEAARHSLAMVLLAGISGAGGWCAVVGVPSFGYVAAAGYGVRMETLGLVPQPGAAWAEVVSALTTGVDAVLVHPPEQVSGQLARRLIAKARRSGCTVLTLGSIWAGSDVRISVVSREWQGLGQGTGRLRRCRVTVVASHRPQVRLEMWLPADDGRLQLAEMLAGTPALPANELRAQAG